MDLQKYRGTAIFGVSFVVVYLLCCVPFVGLLVGLVGKFVVAVGAAVLVSLVLKTQLDRLFASDRQTSIDPTRKAVFISGCDTGFGHELALRLHRFGFHVYAGCLLPDQAGAKQLRDRGVDGRLRVVQCDVTKTAQVNECASHIREELKKMKIDLWAIVNNAGITAFSEFEWIPVETYEKILDVNSLGSVRVTKAFLPLLRATCGRIIIVASLSGRYAIPGMTGYSMSKHAQVALADGLRRELKKFKIEVCLIESGAYKTAMAQVATVQKEVEKHWVALPADLQSAYNPTYYKNFAAHVGTLTGDASINSSEPVDAMFDAVTDITPKLRYIPGDVAVKLRGMVIPLLPTFVQDFLLSKLSLGIPLHSEE